MSDDYKVGMVAIILFFLFCVGVVGSILAYNMFKIDRCTDPAKAELTVCDSQKPS